MSERGQWHQVSFRLSGSLFVGSGRWGFVLPCRPYVPGWTLWGALVVLLKKSGRWPGDYGEIGQRLNQQCWLGHLFLEQKDGSQYLPKIEPEQGGKTMFDWRGGKWEQSPTIFRHGTTVRSSQEQGQDSLGRLFLTETVQPRNYKLTGIFCCCNGESEELLQLGNVLRIGGNRQVSGAEIICEEVKLCSEEQQKRFLRYQHLRCNPADSALALSGELERIVLRRTRNDDGKLAGGFGQHFVDWGFHLAPGWEGRKEKEYQLIKEADGNFRHGTVAAALIS